MVRIKLTGSEENKISGLYLLIRNCNTHSDKLDELVIERKYLKLLDKNNIKYQEIF